MRFRNAAREGQADAGATGLGGVEGDKQVRRVGDAGTIVEHRQFEHAIAHGPGDRDCTIAPVHRVRGLTPGLYLFERDEAVHVRLRPGLRESFLWARPGGCPDHLRLFRLSAEDLRGTSGRVSGHQDIASDGAFSLGMIADSGDAVRAAGAWWYRRLFWEAGVVGQVLYLEAEAAGVRGTGIGCYFDDAFHDLLGLKTDRFQDLSHFTLGGPVEDTRLQTHPPYAHLKR